MTVAALTSTPSTFRISGRKAAVASYGRALSGLRIALSVSCNLKRSAPFREAALIRCCSTAAVAPPQATKQQPNQVRPPALLLGFVTQTGNSGAFSRITCRPASSRRSLVSKLTCSSRHTPRLSATAKACMGMDPTHMCALYAWDIQ